MASVADDTDTSDNPVAKYYEAMFIRAWNHFDADEYNDACT